MKDIKPLAKIRYVCSKCGNEKFKFELYHSIYNTVQRQCGICNKIVTHHRILPEDDEIMNYKRPSF